MPTLDVDAFARELGLPPVPAPARAPATRPLTRPSVALEAPTTLAQVALSRLARYFTRKNHRPSPAMWEALSDLAVTLSAMAEGVAPPKFFLSSLDPGVGKTQTITHFVDALLSSRDHSHVGVLLCVARLTEIEKLVDEMAIPRDNLAVLTRNETINALGGAKPNDAQVLITTQQMIESRLNLQKGQPTLSFTDASLFHFNGQPRAVRVWDESFLPGQTVTLNRDDVAFLFKPMRFSFPKLTQEIEDLFTKLRDVKDGTTMQLPDFAGTHDIDLNDILALFDDHRDNDERKLKEDQRTAVSSLWFLSGKLVTVRTDGTMGNTIIDYRDTLPDDLAPMVILDASGRVRETYRDIEESRGTLVRLATATKRYDRLTLHVWRTGGGKRAFQNNGDKLVSGIAKTINTKPDERWLVVTHCRDGRVGDVEQEVRKLVTGSQENVSFMTWGAHMATNDFVDVPNVILAGTLFFRPSFYEALKRLAAKRPAREGQVTREEIEKVMVGEHAHAILQALCRGAVRRCDNDQCHPCDAYVIASVRSGIPLALPTIFPGATVVPWKPIERSLKGHVKAAVERIEEWLSTAKGGDVLPFKTLSKALGVTRQALNTDIRRHPDFIGAVAELGVLEWGRGVYHTGFTVEG